LAAYRTLPGTERQQANCLLNTGITLDEVGRYEEALTAYQQAADFYRTLPDTERQQADCLNNTGITLYEVGRYEEALPAYRDALAAYRTLPDTERQQANCLLGTGAALGRMGRYEEALTAFQQALAAYRTLRGTERQQVKCLLGTGTILDGVGRYEEARISCRQALTPAIISALESNAARFQFPTEHDRLTWITERAEPSLALALYLASINDQSALVSDLIATFRTGGSIDTTRLTTQGRTTTLGLITPDLTTHPEPNPHPTTPTPTGLALTASPPLGTDATPSANLPRRPGPIFHMPYQRTALADYHSDDDTTRPHAHYR
ncbi:tetratricopeptide repeat protein, partial [uncultured Actinomyces sp.]|uniref:tetratricopeptide repeat protein n=1 Tax=uncultured Actinomyces sp. TaxID=249061 RepID=UPI0028DB7490